MSKSRAAVVLESRQRGMLAEDVGGGAIGEGVAEAHALRDLGDDPPVGLRLAGQRQEGALARDAPLGVRDRAVLLAPGGGREAAHARRARSCRSRSRSRRRRGDRAGAARRARASASGSDTAGFVAMIHSALTRPAAIGLEQLDRLETLALGHPRRAPEAAHPIDLLGREAHMSREHVGEAADLAPAHRVRLAGERERPRARPADAAGGEVAVDDRVDLVGALRGLVHALREAGDGPLRRGEQFEKSLNGGRRKARRPRRRRGRRRDLARSCERLGEARRVRAR